MAFKVRPKMSFLEGDLWGAVKIFFLSLFLSFFFCFLFFDSALCSTGSMTRALTELDMLAQGNAWIAKIRRRKDLF